MDRERVLFTEQSMNNIIYSNLIRYYGFKIKISMKQSSPIKRKGSMLRTFIGLFFCDYECMCVGCRKLLECAQFT